MVPCRVPQALLGDERGLKGESLLECAARHNQPLELEQLTQDFGRARFRFSGHSDVRFQAANSPQVISAMGRQRYDRYDLFLAGRGQKRKF